MACRTIEERTNSMLEIPDAAGEDITDGSPFQLFATMVAIETEEECRNSETTLNNSFISTADETNLEKRGVDIGQPRIEATFASGQISITGTQGRVIADNSKCFRSSDNVTYTIATGGTIGLIPLVVNTTCDTIGTTGNATAGTIDRLEDMSGISLVTNIQTIDNATDQEELEIFRTRLQNFVIRPRRSGNESHYEEWAEEVAGIFRAKAFAVWNGVGTVKVTAIDEDSLPIIEAKRLEMEAYILTQVPISAILTTTLPVTLDINTIMTVTLEDGWDIITAKVDIESEIDKFLKTEVAFLRDEIFYLDMATVINNATSVRSLATLTINGGTGTTVIPPESVATRGTTAVTEV